MNIREGLQKLTKELSAETVLTEVEKFYGSVKKINHNLNSENG